MDRLSRKLAHQLLLDEEFGQAGVQLHVVTMPNTDKSPEGQLLTHVKGVIAEYERTKLAERTARGRLGRAKAGHVWGGSPALGYIAIRAPHQARWEVDAEEAALVRRIFQLCIAGKSTRAIAWQLSQEGILTCLDRRARTAGKKELPRGAWQPASVHRILAYEPYCTGLAYLNKYQTVTKTTKIKRPIEEWHPVQIEPIIDRETFDAAQQQLARNKKYGPRNKKHSYLLSGRLHCATCGRTVSGFFQTSGQKRKYRCVSIHDLHGPKCPGSVSADEIEGQVWAAVERVLQQPVLVADAVRQQSAEADTIREEIAHEQALCAKALERCDREQQRWAQAYAGGVIDLDELRQYRGEIDARRQSLLAQRATYTHRVEALTQSEALTEMLTAYCERVARRLQTFSLEEKQIALEALGIEVTWSRGQPIGITSAISLEVVAPTPIR
jgi:site-specific DNA recombinase